MPADLSALLAHLRGLREKATADPWCTLPVLEQGDMDATVRVITCEAPIDGATEIARGFTEEDAALATAVVNALPVLLRELEALEEARRSGALESAANVLRNTAVLHAAAKRSPRAITDKWQADAAALRRLAAGEETTAK